MVRVQVDEDDYKRILSASGAAFESGRKAYFERAVHYLVRKIAEGQLCLHECASQRAMTNHARALMEMMNEF